MPPNSLLLHRPGATDSRDLADILAEGRAFEARILDQRMCFTGGWLSGEEN